MGLLGFPEGVLTLAGVGSMVDKGTRILNDMEKRFTGRRKESISRLSCNIPLLTQHLLWIIA